MDKKFYEKIEKTKTCWNWKGHIKESGYGEYWFKKSWRAHRYSWFINFGHIPENKIIIHICDNRKCVNPSHLKIGTNKENTRDCVNKGRIARGEKQGISKFTDEEIKEIRKLYIPRKYGTYRLANKFKCSQSNIWEIVKRKTWTHIY